MSADALHVWGTSCSWHGPIQSVGLLQGPPLEFKGRQMKGPGLPCCPFCGSPLFQIEEKLWWDGAERYEAKGHVNYVEFLRWAGGQPRCWPSLSDAAAAFTEATGKPVILTFEGGDQ